MSAARVTFALWLAFAMACRGEPPPQSQAAAPAAEPKPAEPRYPPGTRIPGKDEVIPSIVAVVPETIQVRGGRAATTWFTISYQVVNAERVEKAELRFHAPGLGNVQTLPVTVQASGSLSVDFEPGTFDFGPVIHLRMICPEGTTEWYVLGRDPLPLETRVADVLQIAGAGPDRIPYSRNPEGPQGVVPITMSGKRLTKDCKPEALVNRRQVELLNPYFYDNRWHVAIRHRDLDDRAMSSRYLEVQLSVRGPGFGSMAIKRVPFVE